jgi:hypothetical protein
MAIVAYDGKRLIPAPLINISKQYQKSGSGEIVGKLYTLTITGTLVAYMGSPKANGDFWKEEDMPEGYPPDEVVTDENRLSAIQRKQEALRGLFSVEGVNFEVQGGGGGAPMRCYPRVISIEFPEGIWYERCEYSITLECDELYGGIVEAGDEYDQYISDASEEWSIETNEGAAENEGVVQTYALSHTVSATGKRFYNNLGVVEKEPWEQAKTFVLSKLGLDSQMLVSSGVLNPPSYYQGLNHARSENVNKQGGSYSVTENWILASGTATEDFTINTSDSLESLYKQVTIEGNVKGYDQRDSNLNIITSKWDNAVTKFATVSTLPFIRAQQFSGLSLNITPTTETVGRNPIQGTIGYSYEYNNRPMTLVSGVKSENISITDNLGGELFASVFVLGRAKGPVLQALSTKPVNTRSLSIELVVEPSTYTDRTFTTIQSLINQKPSINPLYSGSLYNIINAANPLYNGFTTVFQSQPQESWSLTDRRYSYSTNWSFE